MTLARPRTARDGFSLPELMIVILVGSLIAAISYPEMSRMLQKGRTEEAAARLEAVLRIAREKALVQRTSYRITLDPVGARYDVDFEESPGVWAPDSATSAPLPTGIGFMIEIDGAPVGMVSEDLVVEPRGTVRFEDVPANITVFNTSGDSIRIEMVRTGRVRSWHL